MASRLTKVAAFNLLRVGPVSSSSRFFNTRAFQYVQNNSEDDCILKGGRKHPTLVHAYSPRLSPIGNLASLLNLVDDLIGFKDTPEMLIPRWTVAEDDKALYILRNMIGQHLKESVPMMEYVPMKAKKDWVKELCIKNKVNFVGLQETKMESIDLFSVKRCWGNLAFESNLLIVVVYAPHDYRDKRILLDYLSHVSNQWNGDVVMMGDFNEVRNKSDRFGSVFNAHGADIFNSFINKAGLEEIQLGGIMYTWCHKSATKMSKRDRFFVAEIAQKIKIRWCVEGNENSKFFYGMLNNKRSQSNIRGVLIDGKWTDEPVKVKGE
nr:RNA-directed DNA polymerase, eukaryota [Tanacetum cinerariifolium]